MRRLTKRISMIVMALMLTFAMVACVGKKNEDETKGSTDTKAGNVSKTQAANQTGKMGATGDLIDKPGAASLEELVMRVVDAINDGGDFSQVQDMVILYPMIIGLGGYENNFFRGYFRSGSTGDYSVLLEYLAVINDLELGLDYIKEHHPSFTSRWGKQFLNAFDEEDREFLLRWKNIIDNNDPLDEIYIKKMYSAIEYNGEEYGVREIMGLVFRDFYENCAPIKFDQDIYEVRFDGYDHVILKVGDRTVSFAYLVYNDMYYLWD